MHSIYKLQPPQNRGGCSYEQILLISYQFSIAKKRPLFFHCSRPILQIDGVNADIVMVAVAYRVDKNQAGALGGCILLKYGLDGSERKPQRARHAAFRDEMMPQHLIQKESNKASVHIVYAPPQIVIIYYTTAL